MATNDHIWLKAEKRTLQKAFRKGRISSSFYESKTREIDEKLKVDEAQQALVDKNVSKNILALPPHKYPLWVKLFAGGILIATLYCLFLLPRYLGAAKKMKSAEEAYRAGRYSEAIHLYSYVLEAVPSSKAAHIGIAEALFANDDVDDDEAGLSNLQGITLDVESWSRIKKVMPAEYQQYFDEVKR